MVEKDLRAIDTGKNRVGSPHDGFVEGAQQENYVFSYPDKGKNDIARVVDVRFSFKCATTRADNHIK